MTLIKTSEVQILMSSPFTYTVELIRHQGPFIDSCIDSRQNCATLLCTRLPEFGRTDRAENCRRMERGDTGDSRDDRNAVDNSFEAILGKRIKNYTFLLEHFMFTNNNMAKIEERSSPLENALLPNIGFPVY